MNNILASIILLSVVGCSTTSVTQRAVAVPRGSSESSITICRQNGGHLALRGVDLQIDGKELTTLRTGDSLEVIVPAGTHRVTLQFPWDSGMRDLEFNVEVLQGLTRNIMIGTNLTSMFILPTIGGGFSVNWNASNVPEMKGECLNPNRPIYRLGQLLRLNDTTRVS